MIDGRISARTTLCVLAGAGALIGGVAGAAIVGKLSTDGSAPAAVARNAPPTAAASRMSAAVALASRSATRGPTPWSAADARKAAARHPHPRRRAAPARPRRAMVAVRAPKASTKAATRTVATTVTQHTRAPAVNGGGSAPPPAVVAPQASTPARSPEPAPRASKPKPSPEPAPTHTPPRPEPAGSFDDSG
jgi:hypothetical protein